MNNCSQEEFVHVLWRKCGKWETKIGKYIGKRYLFPGLYDTEMEADQYVCTERRCSDWLQTGRFTLSSATAAPAAKSCGDHATIADKAFIFAWGQERHTNSAATIASDLIAAEEFPELGPVGELVVAEEATNRTAAIAGDLIPYAINTVAFTWPAAPELEVLALDWLAQLLHHLHVAATSCLNRGADGDVILGARSNAMGVTTIVAASRTGRGGLPRLAVYSSDKMRSTFFKACRLADFDPASVRTLPTGVCTGDAFDMQSDVDFEVTGGVVTTTSWSMGVDVYAASFLIPLAVVAYTLAGGLKAIFLASYFHSLVLHVVFVFLVYVTSSRLGSPRAVHDYLTVVAGAARSCAAPLSRPGQACGPVLGNFKGSYLTMLSSGSLVFGVINIVGSFCPDGVINIYCMRSFAARPSAMHKGYLLGGLLWFALATALGLGALALDLPLTAAEVARGLVPAATATALMGEPGPVLLLVMVFMTVTSAGSAELMAVSSLFTYDMYRTYVNPGGGDGRQILRVSRAAVLVFDCFMGVLDVVLNLAGVSLGWMYTAYRVMIGSGAALAPVTSCAFGVAVWLTIAKLVYGRVDLDTTGRNAPTLAGSLASILGGGAVHVACSLVSPQRFNWEATRCQITTVESVSVASEEELDEDRLLRARRWIVRWGVAFTVLIVVLWPAGRFSVGYFTLLAVWSAASRFLRHGIAELCHAFNGGVLWRAFRRQEDVFVGHVQRTPALLHASLPALRPVVRASRRLLLLLAFVLLIVPSKHRLPYLHLFRLHSFSLNDKNSRLVGVNNRQLMSCSECSKVR
ncbi:hypothetical protein EJB05_41805, partial [Eragrostis curvula]